MQIEIQLRILIISIIIAVIVASDIQALIWASNDDDGDDPKDAMKKPLTSKIKGLDESSIEENPNINKRLIEDQPIIEKNCPSEEELLTIELQKIDLNVPSTKLFSTTASPQVDIRCHLTEFLYENSQKKLDQEIIVQLKELLAKYLERPDKAGLYPNKNIKQNLSFSLQRFKMMASAVLSEHTRLTKFKETDGIHEKDRKQTIRLLKIADKGLWYLGFILCALDIIEGLELFHTIFNQKFTGDIENALLAVIQQITNVREFQETKPDYYMYIFMKAQECIKGGWLDNELDKLVVIAYNPSSSSESVTMNVLVRHSSKTISRNND